MQSTISFILDNRIITIDFNKPGSPAPTTTVLNYLRSLPNHKGVKEGCAEGDCGACTVVLAELGKNDNLQYQAVNSCLLFLPMIHGKQLITVENLKFPEGKLHPVQKAIAESHGTQCGFCTPGIVMSLFALYKDYQKPGHEKVLDAITGNLCRCTGYKPIIEAAERIFTNRENDHFNGKENQIIEMLKSISQNSIQIRDEAQKYFCPSSLSEALKLRTKHPNAFLISGATDVALHVTKQFEILKEILDLGSIQELKQISEDKDHITIGSGVSLSSLTHIVQKYFPALAKMFRVYGSLQIRNLATLGGNLGTASPIGDALPVLIAYKASILVQSSTGQREVMLNDYFKGYRQTELKKDEIITQIKIPRMNIGDLIKSYKISKRKDLDISTLSGGFRLQLDRQGKTREVILAFGGMADRVKRAVSVENYLRGKSWERNTVEEALKLMERDFTPISDVRGSDEFRRVAANNLLLKFWNETRNGM